MTKAKKILVVDDEEEFLALIKSALEIRGFEVMTANNAIVAGMELASNVLDVILMDIKMPGIDGFQACEAIKRNPLTRDIPIIIVSALSHESDMKKARKIGVAGYFVKPVDLEGLIGKINELSPKKNV
jgi:CheY-like chemotaxis protein